MPQARGSEVPKLTVRIGRCHIPAHHPQINPSNAIDLGEVKARAAEREQQQAFEAQRQLELQAQAWDKAMRRAFKGVFPAWKRRIFLKQRLREIEKEQA